MSTIIIGGGIIGLSTAYYLSILESESKPSQTHGDQVPSDKQHHAHHIHVIDRAPSLLQSASGYSGGFLAKDWFSPAAASLGELSFRLHRELADLHEGRVKWGYAPSTAYSLAIDDDDDDDDSTTFDGKQSVGVAAPSTSPTEKKKVRGEDWLLEGTSRANVASNGPASSQSPSTEQSDAVDEMLNADGSPAWITRQRGGTLEVISSADGCAQVEPRELCGWLINQCLHHGVKIHLNSQVTQLCYDHDKAPSAMGKDSSDKKLKIKAVKVRKDIEVFEVDCKNLVITAGAWTPRVFGKLFPDSKAKIPIEPLAGYSIVVRSPRYSRPITTSEKPRETGEEPSIESKTNEQGKVDVTGTCHSVFCAPSPQWSFAPEMISRINRHKPEIYVAGLNMDARALPLPESVTDVKGLMEQEKMDELKAATVKLTGLRVPAHPKTNADADGGTTLVASERAKKLEDNDARKGMDGKKREGKVETEELVTNDLTVVREGLCFRPVSGTGRPIISRIEDKFLGLAPNIELPDGGGVYVAAGHGPWGISLSLGTGLVVAEMLAGKEPSADVTTLAFHGR